jgi:hypothetical protein
MSSRAQKLVIAIASAVVGLILGAASAMTFEGEFMSDAADSRLIADATIYLTAMERLREGDSSAANSVLKQQLDAALLGLRTDTNRLSARQKEQYARIQERVSKISNREPSAIR